MSNQVYNDGMKFLST